MPHMTSMGSSMRMRGRVKGPIRCDDAESSSRFSERYAARKSAMRILASSPGWKEKLPM